eukprot:CAMPEP_0184974608 /NCGR_PEP_ID=MMETSP1098-20130426/6060_1 /TAXON_ID=89044 /ORGANISM="Spumella elongata, Strain CCAP 955/1" /LENGTH=563 /DNA_ID=CAMNT_0027497221 /DNA_START=28 /DNA_END=1719 /DNA_ORIENTATION=-
MASSSATPPPELSEMDRKYQAMQQETQKRFVAGDYPGSIKCGLESLEVAKQLPPLVANTEIVQIHLNVASAFMQMQKFPESLEYVEIACKEAENGIKMRPNQPQAIEVLAITLNTKAHSLLSLNRTEDASVSAERSLALCEAIYPKNDVRLTKILRTVGLVRDRQGKSEDAEKFLYKSYTIISLTLGPQSNDAQMSCDELCNLMLKKNDLASAEKYARINYKSISDKTQDERGQLILGDSSSRLAQVLRRMNRLAEAETLMEQTLAIREDKLMRLNPIGVAYTLSQLAAIQEAQGKVDDEVEARLMKALDIFGRLKGQNSPEVQNTLNQLRNVRSKRNGSAVGQSSEDDGLKYHVSEESKARGASPTPAAGRPAQAISASSNGVPGTATRAAGPTPSAPASAAQTFQYSDTEELARLKFAPDDAMARMMQANTYFEQGRFSCAEVVIAEALEIFLRTKGPDDQMTQAAKQNLGVARSQGLNRLWMQVVAALVLEQEEKLNNFVNATNAEKSEAASGEEKSQVNEYTALMQKASKKKSQGQAKDPVEALLFSDSAPKSGGCVIC